jgi:hypothetical protein
MGVLWCHEKDFHAIRRDISLFAPSASIFETGDHFVDTVQNIESVLSF